MTPAELEGKMFRHKQREERIYSVSAVALGRSGGMGELIDQLGKTTATVGFPKGTGSLGLFPSVYLPSHPQKPEFEMVLLSGKK